MNRLVASLHLSVAAYAGIVASHLAVIGLGTAVLAVAAAIGAGAYFHYARQVI